MASIKDIARICNVSVATVSKALNDKADIGEETKQYIKQVAKEMGYVPQYYARAIRMNKSYNLGVLFMDDAMSGLTHDYFANILNSFKVTAEAQGYDITFINSDKHQVNTKTYLEHCRYRGLDGVVIACINFENEEVIELVHSDVPVVSIDYRYHDVLSVLSDNEKGMEDLVEYIIAQGHQKIAYIYGDISSVTLERVKTFRNTLEKHGIDVLKEYLVPSEYRNLKKASEATKQLLALSDVPTCIIYPDDYSAIGGMGCIREMGLSIPEDISVAGYDDLFVASQLIPRLTTVHQDTEQIGRKAAQLLIQQIEKKEVNKESYIVSSTLKEGKSVLNLNQKTNKNTIR